MGDQDGVFAGAGIHFIDGRRDGLGHHGVVDGLIACVVVHAGVRGHLAEELIQHLLAPGELGALIVGELIVPVGADAELGVPGLVRGGGGHGACHRGLAGLAPAGLVDQPDAVPFAQEQIRPSFTSVRGSHPAMRDWPYPCRNTMGSSVSFSGIW